MSKPLHTIRPTSGLASLNLGELWQYRDLLYAFAVRDVRLRYRQTALGAIWVVLQPLLAAAIFGFVFGRVAKLPTDGIPPFLFAFAGMVCWTVFSSTITKASTVLIQNTNLVSKVYFPRLLMPMAPGASTLLDLAVSLVVLAVLMVIYGVPPTLNLWLAPILLLIVLMLGLGVSFIASSLAVRYRDVQYVIPVVVNLLVYISPVGYSASAVGEGQGRFLYFLNPLAPILDAFRWSIFGVGRPEWGFLAYAAGVAVVVFLVGAVIFRSQERSFADVI
jgi:lipopolysaccharide transport system permease protein